MVGQLPRLPGARRPPPRSPATCATTRSGTSLWASAILAPPSPTCARSLALRERIVDFAVAAQGLDAGGLHERFRAEF